MHLERVVLLVEIHQELVELLEMHLEQVVLLVGIRRELVELLEMHRFLADRLGDDLRD